MASDEPTDEHRDTAALWIAKTTGGSLGREDAECLERWLDEDRRHRRAFDELRVLYAQIEIPARRAASRNPIRRTFFRFARPRPAWLVAPAVGLAAALVIMLSMPHLVQDWQADIVTGQEIVSDVSLPDGSSARLGADTAIKLDFGSATRRVHLLRGEAYFEVRHEESGVFTVVVDGGEVRDIGTKFNVDVDEKTTEVTVAQGAVAVVGNTDTSIITLREGEQAALSQGRAYALQRADPMSSLAWMSGRLVVENARVDDVVRTLQRHMPGRVAVRGWLSDQRISGTFPLTDARASLETVADAVGGSIVRVTPLLTILY